MVVFPTSVQYERQATGKRSSLKFWLVLITQVVDTIDVHGTGATDTFSAGSSEGEGRVDFVLKENIEIEKV